MKSKSWVSIEKLLQEKKKYFIIIVRNFFHLENFGIELPEQARSDALTSMINKLVNKLKYGK